MKKLLSILGTITIAGSEMAGLVGNAPATAKNEINHLQTNNLLRNKRQWNPQVYDINQISRNKNLSVPLPMGYGRNNPPSNSSIIQALMQANSISLPYQIDNYLGIRYASRSGAVIFATGSPFVGSFSVYY